MPIWIINDIKMLYYDKIDITEGSDVNKTIASKECGIFHYWYFLNYCFKCQPNICNKCHDLLMMSMNLTDITISNIKGCDDLCIISLIRKNTDLNEKSRTL